MTFQVAVVADPLLGLDWHSWQTRLLVHLVHIGLCLVGPVEGFVVVLSSFTMSS